MRIYFRHGLYRAERSLTGTPVLTNSGQPGLVARVSNSPIVWSIAHYEKNYTVSEYNTVVFATPSQLAESAESWLYVDLNTATGHKTYGITRVAPSYGPTQPTSPVDDQHWFDTVNMVTKVYSAATLRWSDRVRIVFGHWDGLTFNPMAFGSAVNIVSTVGVASGSVIYDAAGKVLKDSRSRFLTTEDKMFSDSAATHEFSLESNITRAIADENLPAFHVVKWTDFDKVQLADYDDTSNVAVALTLNSATKGNPIELCIQGKIINDAWDWPTVNTALWINENGEFSAIDPFDISTRAARRVPVARVLDRNTIFFDQGLGGMGEKGDAGDVEGVEFASSTVHGITKLSVDPNDPEDPIAVGINDPILTAPRVPLEHGHPATQITVSPFAAFTGTNAQQAFLHLHNAKLETTGGTVTGNITSTVGATLDTHLATLGDVRARIAASDVSVKRFDLNDSPLPTITQAFNSLSAAQRTLEINDLVFVVYNDDVFAWAGGYGLVVAANDSQFVWIGKINFPVPKGDVIVKTFVGTLVVLPEEENE